MKTEDLIKQLTSQAKPVSLLKGNSYRFFFLILLKLFVISCGVGYWYFKKNEIHFPSGRSLWEVLFVLAAVVISSWNITTSVSPHFVRIKKEKIGVLFLAGWLFILLAAFYILFSENRIDALVALNYNTWVCPEVIFSVAIPAAILSFLYLRQGEVLYPRTTFFYLALAAMAAGVLALSFICPWNDPLHELLWHVLPVLIGIVILNLSARILFSLFRPRWKL